MSKSAPLLLLLSLTLLGAAACESSSPVAPPPPPPATLSLACPAALAVSTDVIPARVDYAAPTPSGGRAPVQVSCTIAPGATFPQGTTDVVCTATDAQQARAQCAFSVQVSLSRRLRGTSFLAFGDSLTAGEVSQPVATLHVLDPSRSYPTVLEQSLRQRYVPQAQAITVANHGVPGETVLVGEGRLASVLSALRPDVLLLLEGTNDANGDSLTPRAVAGVLEDGIRAAFARGVKLVLLSTLPPEVPGRPRAYAPQRIIAINEEIRALAARTDAVLIDTFAAFDPQKELLIGEDGLHPTAEGYRRLADLFFAAIRERFEEPVPGTAPAALGLPTLFDDWRFHGR